ncbi:MAG: hypothetical protein ACTSYJ_08105 [Candidatus Thorarchaeota archaeon]
MGIVMVSRPSHRVLTVVSAILVFTMLIGIYLAPCFIGHEYFNDNLDTWQIISVGETSPEIHASYQVALSGDYLGTGEIVTITNYHHGHPGIFIHQNESGTWTRSPLHPLFDSNNENGWPVKGLASADFDSDGYPEIVTAMDVVYYPENHITTMGVPFPGVIYIDPNNPNSEPQPLVWGAWGENITSTGISNCVPAPVSPTFRSPTNDKVDILVPTMTDCFGGYAARVFLLEQPEAGFEVYNYTYVTESQLGVPPYNEEPFYVKRLYVKNGSEVNELVWYPNEVPSATGVFAASTIAIHLDDDDNMDLIVGGGYTDGETFIEGRISLYKRVMNTSISNYLFEEMQTFWIEKGSIGHGLAANLDGNSTNGQESAVFGYSANGSMAYPYSGVLALQPDGDDYSLSGISIPTGIPYPYVRVYSRLVVLDANMDGYDDAIIFCEEVHSWTLNYGDLVVFLNQGGNLSSTNVFGLDEGQYSLLFNNLEMSWGLVAQQLDDDIDSEITICCSTSIPYWCPVTQGAKYAYGLDVIDIISGMT